MRGRTVVQGADRPQLVLIMRFEVLQKKTALAVAAFL